MVTLKQLFQTFGHDPKWGRLATQSAQPMVSVFMRKLGDNFLTVYPNLQLSVKDTEDPETHAPIVATANMLNAANGKCRLGCTVAAKFSRQFSDEVSWQKVDPTAAAAASGEDDITEGGDNQGGGGTGGGQGGELEG